MKYNLTSIFQKIVNETDCEFSMSELWEWTVFNNENSSLKEARDCLVKHKNKGISQKSTYDTIFSIKLIYDNLRIEKVDDFIDEILEYICGYIGNKELRIWDRKM